jgi:hypothetical protein
MSGTDHEIVSVTTFLEYRARRLHAAVARPDVSPVDAPPPDEEQHQLVSVAVIAAPPVLV